MHSKSGSKKHSKSGSNMHSKSTKTNAAVRRIRKKQSDYAHAIQKPSGTIHRQPKAYPCPLSLLKIPLLPNRQSTPPSIPWHRFKYPRTHKIIPVITIALIFRAPRDILFGLVAELPLFAREV